MSGSGLALLAERIGLKADDEPAAEVCPECGERVGDGINCSLCGPIRAARHQRSKDEQEIYDKAKRTRPIDADPAGWFRRRKPEPAAASAIAAPAAAAGPVKEAEPMSKYSCVDGCGNLVSKKGGRCRKCAGIRRRKAGQARQTPSGGEKPAAAPSKADESAEAAVAPFRGAMAAKAEPASGANLRKTAADLRAKAAEFLGVAEFLEKLAGTADR
jgi:hypothetical protein